MDGQMLMGHKGLQVSPVARLVSVAFCVFWGIAGNSRICLAQSEVPDHTVVVGDTVLERLDRPTHGFWRSPTATLFRSVAFPGWGQWTNGKKQKAAVYFAVESYFITKALIWRHRARELGLDFATFDHRRDRRNFFYWMTGITVFVSMFDAYADAYLLDLERTQNAGDEFWGGRGEPRSELLERQPDPQWRLALKIEF